MKEEWKPIADYEGLYMVSSLGRVMSIPRKVPCKNGMIQSVKGGLLTPAHYSNGYCFVNLSKDGIVKTHSLHRLAAENGFERNAIRKMINKQSLYKQRYLFCSL